MGRRPSDEALDALLDGRMGREQASEGRARQQGLHDKEVRRGGRSEQGDALAVGRDLLERAGEGVRMSMKRAPRPPRSRSRRSAPLPPMAQNQKPMRARMVMAPASVAEIEM